MSGISLEDLKDRYHFTVSTLDSRFFQDESCRKVLREHFKVGSLEGLGLGDYDCGVIAAGAVLQYLYETQKSTLDHLTTIVPYATGNYMILDSSTRRNLELLETMREKQKRGSLLWVLDKTETSMANASCAPGSSSRWWTAASSTSVWMLWKHCTMQRDPCGLKRSALPCI